MFPQNAKIQCCNTFTGEIILPLLFFPPTTVLMVMTVTNSSSSSAALILYKHTAVGKSTLKKVHIHHNTIKC